MIFNPTKTVQPFKKSRGVYKASPEALSMLDKLVKTCIKVGVIPVDLMEVSSNQIESQKKVSKVKSIKKDKVSKMTGDDFI